MSEGKEGDRLPAPPPAAVANRAADDDAALLAGRLGGLALDDLDGGGPKDGADADGDGASSGADNSNADDGGGDGENENDSGSVHGEFDNSPSLRTVARWIEGMVAGGSPPKVLVLSGAGTSVAAGIPDFRTPGTGLYDNLAKYNLPYPQAVFDIHFYRKNQAPFCQLASELWPGLRHSPTLTHAFVALLDRKGLLLRNYTQNIDGLEVLAGVSESKIVEAHGHFRTASCANCYNPYDGDACRKEIVTKMRAPKCRRCMGPIKPDIVFFGEGLPDRFHRLLRKDLEDADLLITMGTSLEVAPVSLIPEMVNDSCRRVLMNRELVGDFDPGASWRDVFAEGDCDDSVHALCEMLGWEQELHVLKKERRVRPSGSD